MGSNLGSSYEEDRGVGDIPSSGDRRDADREKEERRKEKEERRKRGKEKREERR